MDRVRARVRLMTTGGTIASRPDVAAGDVRVGIPGDSLVAPVAAALGIQWRPMR